MIVNIKSDTTGDVGSIPALSVMADWSKGKTQPFQGEIV